MNKINALIVDDEPLARERVRNLLVKDIDIEINAECDNGSDALKLIRMHKPDLIFLDIQMPGLNGFQVLENLKTEKFPEIIFVTAYDKYALKAFEVNALDYLLKPFDQDRFFAALKRAKSRLRSLEGTDLNKNINDLLRHLHGRKQLERFVIKNAGRIYFIDLKDVDWLEAEGNYIKLHIGEKTELIRETIKNIELQLDSSIFIRVQRSAIVRISAIKEIQSWFNNNYKIIMKNGEEILSGQKYRDNLKALIT